MRKPLRSPLRHSAILIPLIAIQFFHAGAQAEEIHFVETPELNQNDLLQELVTIQERAQIKLDHHRKEVETLQARLERLKELQRKGYASPFEIREASLKVEKETLRTESFASIESMAGEMIRLVTEGTAGAAPVQEPLLNLKIPTITVDLAGIRLMGLSRPANQEFAQIAFDYLHSNQETAPIGSRPNPSQTLHFWSRMLQLPGAHPAEIRTVERKISHTESHWKLGSLKGLRFDRDLQRLERFGRHLSLREDGVNLPCAFPTLSKPLFLGAGANTLSLNLSKESLALVLPVASAMAAHTGTLLVQEARVNDAERKLRWTKLVYEKGSASLREFEKARLESHIAQEVLRGLKAEQEAKTHELSRLQYLASTQDLVGVPNAEFTTGIPASNELVSEIRSYWKAGPKTTTVLLGLANRFEQNALATADLRAAELEEAWNSSLLQRVRNLSRPRLSELERLEAKLHLAFAVKINAAQERQLRLLELRQWMKAGELAPNHQSDSVIPLDAIRLAKPVAKSKILAAQHYRSAREIDRDYRQDLLNRYQSLHDRGIARTSEVESAQQVLAISQGRLESAERHLQTSSTGLQLIAGFIDSAGENHFVQFAEPRGAEMQLVTELGHLELSPDPGVIKELEARSQRMESRHQRLVKLATHGYASQLEVTQISDAANHYSIALNRYRGSYGLGQLRSQLVYQGLQPGHLLPVSGAPSK